MEKQIILNIDIFTQEEINFMNCVPEFYKKELNQLKKGIKIESFSKWFKRVGYKTFEKGENN
jgi:hypothetical protein